MNTKKAIKICNWVNNNLLDVSPMLMALLIFFGFFGIFFNGFIGGFSFIPFVILTFFIFISFFIEHRLKKEFNLEYDFLENTYKRRKNEK